MEGGKRFDERKTNPVRRREKNRRVLEEEISGEHVGNRDKENRRVGEREIR